MNISTGQSGAGDKTAENTKSGGGLFHERVMAEKAKKVLAETRQMEIAERQALDFLNKALKRGERERFTLCDVPVTPELARLMLSKNDNNRKVKKHAVERWLREMEAGNWEANGETVIMAVSGELNDGQHRLQAVIDANRPIKMDISFGNTRRSRETLGTGTPRSPADVLMMNGYQSTALLAAAARLLLLLGDDPHLAITSYGKMVIGARRVREFVDQNPGLGDNLKLSDRLRKAMIGFGAVHVALHYLFRQKSEQDADEFYDKLATGVGLAKGDPILLLRTRLAGLSRQTNRREIAYLTVRAWNAWRESEALSRLIYDPASALPTIK